MMPSMRDVVLREMMPSKTVSSGTSNGSTSTTNVIKFVCHQPENSLNVGMSVRLHENEWVRACADKLETVGTHIVIGKSGSDITLLACGMCTLPGVKFPAKGYYYTSTTNPGEVTLDRPTTGYINPMFYFDGTSIVIVDTSPVPAEGVIIPSTSDIYSISIASAMGRFS